MSRREDVAVIVAATPASPPSRGRLARFVEEVGGRGEVVLVDGSGGGGAGPVGVRRLVRPSGRLVPELWRDGLEESDAPLVVFTNAALAPRPGWLAALRERADADRRIAVVGGAIAPASGLSPLGRAVFLHRFVRYLPAKPDVDRGRAVRPVPTNSSFPPCGLTDRHFLAAALSCSLPRQGGGGKSIAPAQ